eukprot:TRINITY_DN2688_c0_g1_i1.p1 TRINITY_DN2688_c0_g1~~TRINITY_DN2688_c0_g1_i1.p1  ORF type:complete len:212 (-),score=34.68 TRINITY_DN2688_c0_g1_i1:236-871(-)
MKLKTQEEKMEFAWKLARRTLWVYVQLRLMSTARSFIEFYERKMAESIYDRTFNILMTLAIFLVPYFVSSYLNNWVAVLLRFVIYFTYWLTYFEYGMIPGIFKWVFPSIKDFLNVFVIAWNLLKGGNQFMGGLTRQIFEKIGLLDEEQRRKGPLYSTIKKFLLLSRWFFIVSAIQITVILILNCFVTWDYFLLALAYRFILHWRKYFPWRK